MIYQTLKWTTFGILTAFSSLVAGAAEQIAHKNPILHRQAICGGVHQLDHSTENYHGLTESSFDLPDFEYRGPGSEASTVCGDCHFSVDGHDMYGLEFSGEHLFYEHGGWEYDAYYCGHIGAD